MTDVLEGTKGIKRFKDFFGREEEDRGRARIVETSTVFVVTVSVVFFITLGLFCGFPGEFALLFCDTADKLFGSKASTSFKTGEEDEKDEKDGEEEAEDEDEEDKKSSCANIFLNLSSVATMAAATMASRAISITFLPSTPTREDEEEWGRGFCEKFPVDKTSHLGP